jgi:hypothetical protein
MQWNKPTKWVCALGGAALYFAAALGLKYSYTPPAEPSGDKIALHRPFYRFGNFGTVANLPELGALADQAGDDARSGVLLYEFDHPLGPPHRPHGEIAELGHGRFSHWNDLMVFSASDGTDANTNGRKYWAVLPRNQ